MVIKLESSLMARQLQCAVFTLRTLGGVIYLFFSLIFMRTLLISLLHVLASIFATHIAIYRQCKFCGIILSLNPTLGITVREKF